MSWKRNRKWLIGCAFALLPLLAGATDATNAVGSVSTNRTVLPTNRDPDFTPPLGTYHYTATWGSAEAATATMTVTQEEDDDGHYQVSSRFKLRDAIRKLYQLSYKGSARISSDFLSAEAELYERKGDKRYTTHIKFSGTNAIRSVRIKTIDKKNPETKLKSIASTGATLDPFAAAFLARSLQWKPGLSQDFEVYNGRHTFLLRLECLHQREIEIAGEKRAVWVLSAGVQELDEPDSEMTDSGLKVFLGADAARDILLVKGEAAIGDVRLQLDKFEPLAPLQLPAAQ